MKHGWEIKKLGDIVEIKNGKNQKLVETELGQYKILGSAGNVMGYSSEYICEAGTTIIGRKGNISKPIYINEKFWNVDTAFGLYPKNNFNPKFIYYLCLTVDFAKMNRGTTIPSLVKSEIKEINLKIPMSLPEQERIVSILDKAFFAINQAKQNAEKNLKNAKELFDSYLSGIFTNKGDDWEVKKLADVCEYEKIPNKKPDLPYIGLEDIQSNTGVFIGGLTPKVMKSLTFYFNEDHILYGRLRPYLNKILIPKFEGHCSTEIFPIKPKSQIVDKKYLFQWLKMSDTVKKINSTWTGATLPRANMNSVLEFEINIPPLKEQQSIVQKLDELSVETKQLEQIYQQKIIELEDLKKSILQKAFNGELC